MSHLNHYGERQLIRFMIPLFVSASGNLNWWPRMVMAICNMFSIVPGKIIVG